MPGPRSAPPAPPEPGSLGPAGVRGWGLLRRQSLWFPEGMASLHSFSPLTVLSDWETAGRQQPFSLSSFQMHRVGGEDGQSSGIDWWLYFFLPQTQTLIFNRQPVAFGIPRSPEGPMKRRSCSFSSETGGGRKPTGQSHGDQPLFIFNVWVCSRR